MKLVALNGLPDGRVIYVNADAVVAVVPYLNQKGVTCAEIRLSDGTFQIVDETVVLVAKMLRDA
jgi:hypothetical protein